jgi:quercetin dioxygenase-like cupin family protein
MKQTSLTQILEQGVSHNPAIRKKVLFPSSELPHLLNFAQARFAPGQVAAAHSHCDMWEVFFVEAGNGTIIIDGHPYPLTAGVCIAVEPGELHEVSNTGDGDLTLTYFALQA